MGHRVIAIVLVALGLMVVLRAANVIPADMSGYHAPRWVVGTIGLAFALAGVALVTRPHRSSGWMGWAAGVCLVTVMVWFSLYSRPEEWGGGSPFLSPRANGLVVKIGCAFIASIAGAVLAFWGWFKARGFLAGSRRGSRPGRDN